VVVVVELTVLVMERGVVEEVVVVREVVAVALEVEEVASEAGRRGPTAVLQYLSVLAKLPNRSDHKRLDLVCKCSERL
jgi:hypothetical protein